MENNCFIIKRPSIKNYSLYFLCLFVILVPFEYLFVDILGFSLIRYLGIIVMIFAFFDALRKGINLSIFKPSILIIAWCVYAALSFFWTRYSDSFLSTYSIYVNNALMLISISMVKYNENEFLLLKKAYIVSVILFTLYMLVIPNATIYSQYQHRLTFNVGNSGLDQNYLASLMIMPFGFMIYDLLNVKLKKINMILYALFSLLVLYFIIMSGSRSGIISCLLIIIFSSIRIIKKRAIITLIILLIMILAISVAIKFLPKELYERFSLDSFLGKTEESSSRTIIWKIGLESINFVNFFFGRGVGSAPIVIGNAIGLGKNMGVHNHYLSMIIEVGIIGLIFILLPIIKMMKFIRKKYTGVVISFLGILTMAFFIDVITTKFFWTAFIFLTVCYSSYKDVKKGV